MSNPGGIDDDLDGCEISEGEIRELRLLHIKKLLLSCLGIRETKEKGDGKNDWCALEGRLAKKGN